MFGTHSITGRFGGVSKAAQFIISGNVSLTNAGTSETASPASEGDL